ncbi:MAG: DJ-1/PfpI family protein [Oscillospiraceae bacterium]
MIYVFLASGFEEIEALTSVDILRRCEQMVQTVGVGGRVVRGSHGIPVVCDLTAEEIMPSEAEAIILPGGMPGTLHLEESVVVQKMIRHCVLEQKWIGAICAAPSILGHMGLLRDKNATCFTGFEGELEGARFVDAPVVKDGKIITSRGAGTAFEFAFALAEVLSSAARVETLKAGMQWRK